MHSSLCDLLGIDFPIIQAGMGAFTSAELVAAVSEAGGIGSLGAGFRTIEELRRELERVHSFTDRPFIVNHALAQSLNEEAIEVTLKANPRVVSFALADPGELVKRVHDAGILVMHQTGSVEQALRAAESGVDVIIAQGMEAGGFGGALASLSLIPQVVDAVSPIPVVAAGGIADGRGLAAAFMLGAAGANVGTRFLASVEAPVSDAWKAMIVGAKSEDAVRFDVWGKIFPASSSLYDVSPRALRTAFIRDWEDQPDEAAQEAEQLRSEILEAIRMGKMHDFIPFTGESAGLIREVLPAGEIVRTMATEARSICKEGIDPLT